MVRRERRIEGIDVSHWEGNVDFRRVREAGIRFVYMKASEGERYIDPEFERNYREARREHLKIGFYHYVTARNVEESRRQGRHFANVIFGKTYQGRPVMDYEFFGEQTREQINDIALAFLREVQESTGTGVAIYSDANNASQVFDARLSVYPLWIAEYGVGRPDMENPWERWSGWQYTDRGHISGVRGEVDRDYFRESMLISRESALQEQESIDFLD